MKLQPLAGASDEWRWAVDGLRAAGEYAAERGVSVALECWTRFETYFLNRLEQAVKLCEAVGLPNGGVMGDTFHMNIEEASLARPSAARDTIWRTCTWPTQTACRRATATSTFARCCKRSMRSTTPARWPSSCCRTPPTHSPSSAPAATPISSTATPATPSPTCAGSKTGWVPAVANGQALSFPSIAFNQASFQAIRHVPMTSTVDLRISGALIRRIR